MLFSLYINGVVTRLHDGKCGVQCGGDKEMVEEKAAVGRRALSAWLNRCKAEAGDVAWGRNFQETDECSG